ncbi:nitroreductase/quinone reductase family protein [Agrococcus sp. ARC_14]|uniref:nitroreductase/quinone reductase family protein n=1 Tax=Agrococcus sp. ARC_14 TaxID=2919927 RepID=UPI001F06374F|nr:nitroreductase/quinone reductase family protein [Agrococcus sp. ARC_14]MCH1883517.1 nitroreductase family deazaflavin-dependent oxidoreductase [Agrococcus sp. ARC_14]
MSETVSTPPSVPPRWFIRTAWVVHRGLYAITGGRFGLARPRPGKYGMLRLHTVGRTTAAPRVAILAYYEDGQDLVLMAMNGWADAHPAWWLNLRAHPDASVDLPDGSMRVRAREAQGLERERLLAGWEPYSDGPSITEYEQLRTRRVPMIVLEPTAG